MTSISTTTIHEEFLVYEHLTVVKVVILIAVMPTTKLRYDLNLKPNNNLI